MANELTKVELYGPNNDGNPRRFTCASGTAIAKGTLLKLSDPTTAAASAAAGDVIAGVAAMDKDATDYSTSISVWTDGIFEAVASGAIICGAPIQAKGSANLVMQAASTASGAAVIGYALGTASEAETINVRLRL